MKVRRQAHAEAQLETFTRLYRDKGQHVVENFLNCFLSTLDRLEFTGGIHVKYAGLHPLFEGDIYRHWRVLRCRGDTVSILALVDDRADPLVVREQLKAAKHKYQE